MILGSLAVVPAGSVHAHDIPNARVDRATQVILRPGRVDVSYEVSLAELTLTQELRLLVGTLPGAGRSDWFAAYGNETGPLNAKGLLVSVNGESIPLEVDPFTLAVEEHPRFTFHYHAAIPPAGRFLIRDTNFATSEGTSRLAIRGDGLAVTGDDLPGSVEAITARPIWQMSDLEERRSRQVAVDYHLATALRSEGGKTQISKSNPIRPHNRNPASGLSDLLDDAGRAPWYMLAGLAVLLGAAHALEPGHGKTLVAATAVSEGGHWLAGVALGLVTTLAHAGSVFLVAAALWWTQSRAFSEVHVVLTRVSGFVIAAIGVWRLGRLLGGSPVHEHGEVTAAPVSPSLGRILALGVAGGFVPCWDAVGLVVLAAAVGRLALGVLLVGSFSAGMAIVLMGVGGLAARVKRSVPAFGPGRRWERRLGLASAMFLSALGLYLLKP